MGRPTTIGKLTAYHHATYGNLSHLTPLSGAELLAPAEPGKVIAIVFNYGRHLGDSERAQNPGVFIKLPSAIVGTGAEIVYPEGASNVHFEVSSSSSSERPLRACPKRRQPITSSVSRPETT